MKKAIFYKEWIKVRWYILAMIIIGISIETIMFLKLGRSFRFAGHEHLWDVIINKQQFMFSYIKYYALSSGLAIGIAQFAPEIINKRLKLSMHLPLKEANIITWMFGSISGILLLVFVLLYISLLTCASFYFPYEIVYSVASTTLPWFLAGITSYFLVAFCLLEPIVKRKVINTLLSLTILFLFFMNSAPMAYNHTVIVILSFLVISILLVYYSVYRFKTGAQAA